LEIEFLNSPVRSDFEKVQLWRNMKVFALIKYSCAVCKPNILLKLRGLH